MLIRTATLDDCDTIIAHRRAMFSEMGHRDEAALDAMTHFFRPWLRRKMEAREYLTWLAIAPDGAVAGGTGLWLMDWAPHMIGPGTPRGNILNVYTAPQFRRQGIARRLVTEILNWCRANRIHTVILHASQDGRSLYEALGFQPTNEMRLNL